MARLYHLFIGIFITACLVQADTRLNCLLTEHKIDQETCLKRGCHWAPISHDTRTPPCYLDTSKVGYSLKSPPVTRKDGLDATLIVNPEAHKSIPFPLIEQLKLEVHELSEDIVRIRITDPEKSRYEVPIASEFTIPIGFSGSAKYEVSLNGSFNLVVTRKETGVKILDTSIGGLIFSDRFIQFPTKLATSNLYGLGENYHTSLKHKLDYATYPLFARDFYHFGLIEQPAYGVHPFYTVLEEDGKSHGVFLLNSNAMAYTFLPAPGLSIKTIGGVLDFFVFVGDNPEHVVQLYTSIIGRSVLPPFWGLGFQLCRFKHKTLDNVKKVVQRNLDHGMPIDVKYVDFDYADDWKDFTLDQKHFAGLPAYINETKQKYGMHWAFIVDPGIRGDKPDYKPFVEGYKRDVFVKWPDSIPPAQRSVPGHAPTDKGVMYAKVWADGPVAFPDFFKNATKEWWIEMIKEFHHLLNYDALWIDMNEPAIWASNYLHCPNDSYGISLPSQNYHDSLNSATLCMDAVQGEKGEYRHYDVHSLYGWSETKPTYLGVQAATGKRGFVLSRSTYASSGRYTGHWLGDNNADFVHLRQSIVGILEFNLFGVSYSGVDICGFNGNTTPELCKRWLQLGAYYPFSRSHNADWAKDQDPGYFVEIGHPEVTKAAVDAYTTRYQLMHYLYTLFYRSHVFGETVARPMHHVFPKDIASRTITEQFFLGSSILVAPFLYPNQHTVNAYVPVGTEWFQMEGSFVTKSVLKSGHIEIPDSSSHRPLLLKAGSIIPIVGPKSVPKPLNAPNIRKVPIELWVLPTVNGTAAGDLFYDDGESIDTVPKGEYNFYEFKLDKCKLTIELKHKGYRAAVGSHDILKVESINIALPLNPTTTDIEAKLNEKTVLKSTIVEHNNVRIETEVDLLAANTNFIMTMTLNTKSNHCIFA